MIILLSADIERYSKSASFGVVGARDIPSLSLKSASAGVTGARLFAVYKKAVWRLAYEYKINKDKSLFITNSSKT